jgi:hypothetical protein
MGGDCHDHQQQSGKQGDRDRLRMPLTVGPIRFATTPLTSMKAKVPSITAMRCILF